MQNEKELSNGSTSAANGTASASYLFPTPDQDSPYWAPLLFAICVVISGLPFLFVKFNKTTSKIDDNIDVNFERIAEKSTNQLQKTYEAPEIKDEKKKVSSYYSRIYDTQNARIALLFKNLLRSTLHQLENGYLMTMGMYVATFLLGVVLIVIGLYMAVVQQESLFALLFTSVGGLDILLFFFNDPPAKIEQSRNNFAAFIAPYYAWHIETVNRHDLLSRYRIDMAPDDNPAPGAKNPPPKNPVGTPTDTELQKRDENDKKMKEIDEKKLTQPDKEKIWDELLKIEKKQGTPTDTDLQKILQQLKTEILDEINKKIKEIDKKKLEQPERKKIWDEIFEMEKTQSRALLEDTYQFLEMMGKITPLQSIVHQTQKESSEPEKSTPLNLTSIDPNWKNAGEGDFELVVTGTGFVEGSIVRFAGSDRTPKSTSSTKLTVTIEKALIAVATTTNVIVVNPGDKRSNEMTFTVK
ncbi:MAG TPA: hypothetical protein PK955_02115 [Methanoregulaceae archaeon]|nr:hypothetical protein [Methanoregulaceae archaeon]